MLRDEAEGTGTARERETAAETARAVLVEIREPKSLRMTEIRTTTTRSICRPPGTIRTIRETGVRALATSLTMGKAPATATAVEMETATAVETAASSGSGIPEMAMAPGLAFLATDRTMGFVTMATVS